MSQEQMKFAKFCGNCGTPRASENSKFCGNCGTSLALESSITAQAPSLHMNLSEENQEDFDSQQELFDDFAYVYHPIPNPQSPQTYLFTRDDLEFVRSQPERNVWTVIWNEDTYATAGFEEPSDVGDSVTGYLVCETFADDDESDQIIVFREYECNACEGDGCDECDDSGFYTADFSLVKSS